MTTIKELKKDKEILIKALVETLWMANRYSKKRLTYAPSMFNDAFNSVKKLLPENQVKRIEEGDVIKSIEEDNKRDIEHILKNAKKKFTELIDDVYRDLDMGKTIPIFIQRVKQKLEEM